jgi:hypothetical protein
VVRGQSPDPRGRAYTANSGVSAESDGRTESVGDCAVAGGVEGLVNVAEEESGADCCVVRGGIQGEVREGAELGDNGAVASAVACSY